MSEELKKVSKKKVSKKATKKVSKKKAAKKTASKKTATAKVASAEPSDSTSIENRIEQLQAMLQDNLSGLSGDRAEQMAKNIWLAGLGAYSKTYEELSDRYDNVQERYEEINAEGQKMFDKLVERGKSMQGDFEEVVSQRRSSLEERVEEFRERFGGGLSAFVDIPSRLRDAAEKIDELSEKLKKKD